jgi:hypothetical protein
MIPLSCVCLCGDKLNKWIKSNKRLLLTTIFHGSLGLLTDRQSLAMSIHDCEHPPRRTGGYRIEKCCRVLSQTQTRRRVCSLPKLHQQINKQHDVFPFLHSHLSRVLYCCLNHSITLLRYYILLLYCNSCELLYALWPAAPLLILHRLNNSPIYLPIYRRLSLPPFFIFSHPGSIDVLQCKYVSTYFALFDVPLLSAYTLSFAVRRETVSRRNHAFIYFTRNIIS